MPEAIDRSEGRRLFGADPETYDRARPGHAERVYEVLVERCGLGPGTSVVEVGPGTGQATRRLLELGATPLVAIEPNPELADYLSRSVGAGADVRVTTLEEAELPSGAFDLAAAASSFHWIDEASGLAIVFDALRPRGWIALWWTGFGDRARADPFHEATKELLESMPRSPVGSHRAGRTPSEGGSPTWLAALAAARFEDAAYERIPWTRTFDAKEIRAIFSTFSPFLFVDEATRTEMLDALERIALEDFGDRVEKPIVTALYTARKPS
jgi:SAM-dependent methyltransferase